MKYDSVHMGLYPIIIREARYMGMYSRGAWVLTTGCRNPDQETDAFDSDIPCMDFWQERENNGPIVRQEAFATVMALSGPTPDDCLEQLETFIEEEFPTCEECDDLPRAFHQDMCYACELSGKMDEWEDVEFTSEE